MTTENDDLLVLVCGNPKTAIAYSVPGKCANCQRQVVVSAEGIEMMSKAKESKTLCFACGVSEAEQLDENLEIDRDRLNAVLALNSREPLTDEEWVTAKEIFASMKRRVIVGNS